MRVSLEQMPADRLGSWIERTRAEYVDERIQAGDSPEEARAAADRSYDQLFPQGLPAANHRVFDTVVDGRTVGYIWIGPLAAENLRAWWVWGLAVDSEHRRNGFGREAMILAEAEVRERGGDTLGLNVFGFNTPARALYASLGYATTAVHMRKVL